MKKIKLKEKFDFLYKNVESQKTDEGEKFTVSVTPKNYPIFIKLFPLKYDVVLSETGYEGYPEGKMKINTNLKMTFISLEAFVFLMQKCISKKINLKKNMKLKG